LRNFGNVETLTWRHGDTEHGDIETSRIKRKRKPRRFSLSRLLFAHRATEVCRLSICWGSYPFANGLNGLAHLGRFVWKERQRRYWPTLIR
jgi:hypothetical protein